MYSRLFEISYIVFQFKSKLILFIYIFKIYFTCININFIYLTKNTYFQTNNIHIKKKSSYNGTKKTKLQFIYLHAGQLII